jgi:putative FmdB family regulatory protein
MPTYEYACRNCDEHIEVVQSFRDDPLEECGLCGGTLRKVFSAAGIIFKGSGYYVTDTRAERQGRSSAATGSSSGSSSSEKSTSNGDASSGSSSAGSTGKGADSGSSSSSSDSTPSTKTA